MRAARNRRADIRGPMAALVIAGLALAGAGTSGAAGAAPTASSPNVVVTPATGLTNLQAVTVSGSGLTPGDAVSVREDCRGFCHTFLAGPVTVGADGRVSVSVSTRRYLRDSEASDRNEPIDCAYDTTCSIELTHPDDSDAGFATITSRDLGFSGAVPATPSATLDAPQPLPPVVVTTVHGHGFAPGGTVYVAQCSSQQTTAGRHGFCRMYDQPDHGTADGAGNVAIAVNLRRHPPLWNCADPTTTCSVRLWDAQPNVVTLPVVFDPTAAAPPTPTITVDHTTALGVGPTVHVHGGSFRPDRDVQLTECRVIPTSDGPACSSVAFDGPNVTVRSRADGTFDTTLTLQRYLMNDDPIAGAVVDCATVGTCGIVGREDPQDPPAPVPLSFALHSGDPVITFTGAFVLEGTGNTPTPVLAHAHLDRPADHPVRFRLNSTDYSDTVVTFDEYTMPAGATEMTIPLAVRADAVDEPTEVVHFFPATMTGAQFAVAAPNVPVVIIDDDPPPTIVVDDALVAENDPSGLARVHVHLTGQTAFPVTVHYRTRRGTARPGADYRYTAGTATMDPSFGAWVYVPLVDDHRPERLEHFDVTFSNARHAKLPDTSARVWIADND